MLGAGEGHATLRTMDADQKYLFDLTGYLVLRSVLTPAEIALCNAAIDAHEHEIKIQPAGDPTPPWPPRPGLCAGLPPAARQPLSPPGPRPSAAASARDPPGPLPR